MNNPALVEKICQTLDGFLPEKRPIALHEPCFAGNESSYVTDCIETGWVSSVGAYVDRFEQMLKDYTGAGYAVAAVNGTAALHICLQLAGVAMGDEVLIPALTFVATANAVSYRGARPHFVDVEESSLGVAPGRIREYLKDISEKRSGTVCNRFTGRPIRAIVPMHSFGHPVDMDELLDVAAEFGIAVVEDAAESLGSMYNGKHAGTLAPLGCLSFNGNKIITTGGGGAILVRDQRNGALAKHLTTQAKLPHRWAFEHDMVGYNYRLPNINAALGCAQMEQLQGFVEQKRQLAQNYMDAFAGIEGVAVFREAPWARSNYWLNVLMLDENCQEVRDSVLDRTKEMGIMTRPAWALMPKLPMYNDCPRMDLPVSESMEQRIINIPSSAFLRCSL